MWPGNMYFERSSQASNRIQLIGETQLWTSSALSRYKPPFEPPFLEETRVSSRPQRLVHALEREWSTRRDTGPGDRRPGSATTGCGTSSSPCNLSVSLIPAFWNEASVPYTCWLIRLTGACMELPNIKAYLGKRATLSGMLEASWWWLVKANWQNFNNSLVQLLNLCCILKWAMVGVFVPWKLANGTH